MAHIDARAAGGSDAILEGGSRVRDMRGAVDDLVRTAPPTDRAGRS